MATTIPRDSTPASKSTSASKKERRTFMLHSPSDMSSLGRFISTDWRYAALKAASRGHTDIYLRHTGTREVRQFMGSREEVAPKQIVRGGRTITYSHQPRVKFIRKFKFTGTIDDSSTTTNPKAS